MRFNLRPYHLLLLLVASASLLSLWKINKRSFYFHYFKVIEEVELRNSQALADVPAYFESVQQKQMEEILPFLGFLLGIIPLFLLLFESKNKYLRHFELAPRQEKLALQCLPIRAP